MANETLILSNVTAAIVQQPSGMESFNRAFDTFLSVTIPLVVFGMFGYMIYTAFQDPIDAFIAWVKDKWSDMNPPIEEHTARYTGITLDSRAEIYK
jgi:hypothetical protein